MRVRDKAGRTGQSKARERKRERGFSSAAAAAAVAVLFSTGSRGACVFLVGANRHTVVEEEAHGDFTRSRRLDAARLPVWLPEFWPALRVPLGE